MVVRVQRLMVETYKNDFLISGLVDSYVKLNSEKLFPLPFFD